MTPIETLPELRKALLAFMTENGKKIPAHTVSHLQTLVLDPIPPVWAVKGFEILFSALDDLPTGGNILCAQAAEQVARYGYYGQGDRAYAVLHMIKAALGDEDADPSVTAPEPDPAYQA
jgi:hypothetical protein